MCVYALLTKISHIFSVVHGHTCSMCFNEQYQNTPNSLNSTVYHKNAVLALSLAIAS